MKTKILSLAMLVAFSGSAFADEGADIYKRCAGCHGASGEKAALGKSKIIKDMSKADFVKALKGYKDGTYGGVQKGLMKGQVTNLTDAQMEAVAAVVAK